MQSLFRLVASVALKTEEVIGGRKDGRKKKDGQVWIHLESGGLG